MIYKVTIDITESLLTLNKMGINNLKGTVYFFVEAENPDEACHRSLDKLKTSIIEQNLTDEIVDYLEDELHHHIKTIGLTGVSPHL